MVETSFSGATKLFAHGSQDWFPSDALEFASIGRNIFEKEDLVNAIYETYIPLLSDCISGQDKHTVISDIGMLYINGSYMPCTERIVLSGQVDMTNDAAVDFASLVLGKIGEEDGVGFIVAKKTKLPRGYTTYAKGPVYSLSWGTEEAVVRREKKMGFGSKLVFSTDFVVLKENGEIIPASVVGGGQSSLRSLAMGVYCRMAAVTINAWQDASDHVWKVKTKESLLGPEIRTPLTLGCSAEHIKSLFYAREAPISESGRRRPILHWVRQHQRRVKSGIDIDIHKHLRGVVSFEMDGFSFEITSPTKDRSSSSPSRAVERFGYPSS
jgi:hypothetical protein